MYQGNIILLGAPGSGKGTLSKELTKRYEYVVICTGDILRNEKRSGSDIGNQIKDIIGRGNLVTDELINKIVQKVLYKNNQRFILDGFPRTIPQAKFLDEVDEVDLVIYLDISDETLTNRILERGKTSGREDDQSVDIINKRIKQFKEETLPLVDFYEKKSILVTIDAEQTVDEVFNDINNIIKLWN